MPTRKKAATSHRIKISRHHAIFTLAGIVEMMEMQEVGLLNTLLLDVMGRLSSGPVWFLTMCYNPI